jgi:hypothetical protein
MVQDKSMHSTTFHRSLNADFGDTPVLQGGAIAEVHILPRRARTDGLFMKFNGQPLTAATENQVLP